MTDAQSVDEPVADDVRLHRRITHHHLKTTTEGSRISSAAFQQSSDGSGVSVNLEDTMQRLGITPSDLMSLPPTALGIAYVTAGQARQPDIAHDVVRAPEPPDDPSHGNLIGRSTDGRRRRLARLADGQRAVELPATG